MSGSGRMRYSSGELLCWLWGIVVLWRLTRLSRGEFMVSRSFFSTSGDSRSVLAALCFNLPLSLLGLRVLGSGFGVKTFICFILVAVFSDSLPAILLTLMGEPIPTDPLVALDPFKLGDEVLLACIFGGVVMGVGVGMIMKSRASSGGTDVLSNILHKWTHRPLGQLQMMVDSCIVIFGFLMFQDWKVPMYSWLSIFLMGKTIDMILQGFNAEKSFFIISDKIEEIRAYILNDLHRGGSIVPIQGMYNRSEKEMIMTMVNRRQMATLQQADLQVLIRMLS